MDSVDPDLVDDVETVLAGTPGVESVESVRLRWIGHELRAEATITSASDLSLADAHAISEEAHHRLLHEVPRLREAIIHSNPHDREGNDPHALTAHHFRRPL
jgi:divalent metal cation (Fe/Co/Zn/Cd) transporter